MKSEKSEKSPTLEEAWDLEEKFGALIGKRPYIPRDKAKHAAPEYVYVRTPKSESKPAVYVRAGKLIKKSAIAKLREVKEAKRHERIKTQKSAPTKGVHG